MTIDEAIKHCEEVAEAEERSTKLHQRPDSRIKGSGKRYLSCLKCAEEHRQLAEWLRELKELRGQTKWIPCSERLPESDDEVLVTDDACGLALVGIDWFDSDGNRWWCSQNVTAWMPLPNPYRGGESE